MDYIFGLSFPATRAWVEARWRAYRPKDRDAFVRDVLLTAGPHVQPLLAGDADTLTATRRQHLAHLIDVFGRPALTTCLRREFDAAIPAEPVATGKVGPT